MQIVPVVSLAAVVMLASIGAAPAQNPTLPMQTLIQTFQEVWNAHDAARLAELFSDDADQIVATGPATSGRPAIRRWWEARFAAMPQGRTISLTSSSVRLISPDVGVINTIAVTGGRDGQGQPITSSTDRGSWVVVNRAGQWRIAALRVHQAELAPSRQ